MQGQQHVPEELVVDEELRLALWVLDPEVWERLPVVEADFAEEEPPPAVRAAELEASVFRRDLAAAPDHKRWLRVVPVFAPCSAGWPLSLALVSAEAAFADESWHSFCPVAESLVGLFRQH